MAEERRPHPTKPRTDLKKGFNSLYTGGGSGQTCLVSIICWNKKE